jgi:hypothetical protein
MNSRAATRAGRTITGALLMVLMSGPPVFAQSPPAGGSAPTVAAPASTIDIRDIRGPEPIQSPWLWTVWLVGAALLATGGYAAWRWQTRRRLAPEKLPYEIALERLEAIRALMHPDSVRAFSIEASDIVRRYVEAHFQVMAAHRTTEEFLHDLLDPFNALLVGQRSLLADFLQHCDLAKFGAWRLSVAEMETMHRSARRFVFITGKPGLADESHEADASPTDKDTYDSLPST